MNNIYADWDNEYQTIIRFLYRRSSWEWHDFYAALDHTRLLLEESQGKVGFIIDIANGGLTPGIFMSQAKILYDIKRHPSVSMAIVIGADKFIQALYSASMADIVAEHQFYFANSRDDAHAILDTIQ